MKNIVIIASFVSLSLSAFATPAEQPFTVAIFFNSNWDVDLEPFRKIVRAELLNGNVKAYQESHWEGGDAEGGVVVCVIADSMFTVYKLTEVIAPDTRYVKRVHFSPGDKTSCAELLVSPPVSQ